MGNLLTMEDPRGDTWTFAYDAAGRLTSQTDPLNNTTAYEYDGANNRTAIINAFLKRFEFEYDEHNNLIKATDPYEKYITTEYNTDNLPLSMVDQEGKTSGAEYDNEGRVTTIRDGAGNEIAFHYDETQQTYAASDKPVRIDYPTYTRRLYYDRLQRVIQEIDELDGGTQHSRAYTYDVSSVTDEQGNTTLFDYDALNRLIRITDPLQGVTERTYDNRDNLISLRDPNNGITYYEYDRNNRLTKVIRPIGEETAYGYDEMGNLTSVIDPKGQRIEYTYNAINRLTRVRYFNPDDHINSVKTVDFTYDKLGNILTYNDGITSATYTYDDLQRKLTESVNYGPFSLGYSYTYYANGLKKAFTGPDGNTINYTYDSNNRISGIAIPGQGQITYNTYQWNSPAKVTLPGGSSREYTYDPLMQAQSIISKDPAQNTLMTRSYQYSSAGNITTKDTEHGAYTYQYDELYRLTQATNPTISDEAYTYDPLGNRLTSAAVTGSWTYNVNNELLGHGDTSYQHDDNGNLTNKTNGTNSTNYIYDVEDRLVEVQIQNPELGTQNYFYYYDPFGRRLWKEVDGTRTYFLYSDEGLIGEYDASGVEIKTYGYKPGSTWTTDPLFMKMGSEYYFYQNDHIGTPQKMAQSFGQPSMNHLVKLMSISILLLLIHSAFQVSMKIKRLSCITITIAIMRQVLEDI
jgi:YD repeat-containing protein